MINFPVPYSNELIYSTIARFGVHTGITSSKALLDIVFSDRKVTATVDLPCQLQKVSGHYPRQLGLDVEALAYKHTLFPLYAPFVSEERRKNCLKWMEEKSKGAVHLALGVAASRVKQKRWLGICPDCMKEQLQKHGEYYWVRDWQVSGLGSCFLHGDLLKTPVLFHGHEKHEFKALDPHILHASTAATNFKNKYAAMFVKDLLELAPMKSPTYAQWHQYYRSLAHAAGCTKGYKVIHNKISKIVLSNHNHAWLEGNSLLPHNQESCWLRAIFRKHRKAFSCLEHFVVLDAFLPKGWNIGSVLNEVAAIRPSPQKISGPGVATIQPGQTVLEKRRQWHGCLEAKGVKQCRMTGGAALYAWLYRNDREWLLKINERYHKPIKSICNRVDWGKRDAEIKVLLLRLMTKSCLKPGASRRSKKWILSQLGCSPSVAKNLEKLPGVNRLLNVLSEDVESYQVRRILRAIADLVKHNSRITRWRILRMAGLSEERIKPGADTFLNQVVGDE